MNVSSQDMAAVTVWSQHHLQDSAYFLFLQVQVQVENRTVGANYSSHFVGISGVHRDTFLILINAVFFHPSGCRHVLSFSAFIL